MDALEFHEKFKGKIEIKSKVRALTDDDLKIAYTPGVSEPCIAISKDKNLVNKYTNRWNSVAIVTDGSAVLGLGNIGPEAALPVMEGKAVLFKAFGAVDAYPICLRADSASELISHVKALEPCFGGINLEDIAAPKCFDVETDLIKNMAVPVFHDDQHGTAIVVLAGLINACLLTKRRFDELKVVINGAGAAGIAIAKLLMRYGVKDLIICDTKGSIHKGRSDLNKDKMAIAGITNAENLEGRLGDIIKERSVFIGVSAPGVLTGEMVEKMDKEAIVFAMANPVPEIFPIEALDAGAAIIATGRSDFSNQINNVLAFPGIFRGLLDAEASIINEDMKIAAAEAIARLAQSDGIKQNYIVPKATDLRVGPEVAGTVADMATRLGIAKRPVNGKEITRNTKKMLENIHGIKIPD